MAKDSGYQEYAWKSDESFGVGVIYDALVGMLGPRPARRILDIGCGNGALARGLASRGHEVWGVDASDSGIERANNHQPGHFFRVDIATGRLPDELSEIAFDTVISTEVIEHLYNPHDLLAFARAALQRNGSGELLITTPYHGYLKNLVIALSGKFDHHVDARTTGGHIKFFSRRSLEAALRDAGFRPTAFRGCGRFPYIWKSMLVLADLAP